MIYNKLSQQAESSESTSITKSEEASDFTSVTYTSYEDLPNFYCKNTSFEEIFQILLTNTKDKLDWKAHFDVVESLRILNKYHNIELLKFLNLFIPFLYQGIDSLRSNLSKNSLLFIKELIHYSNENSPSEELISKVLPLILDKAVSDKGFIKNEAKNVIKEFEKNGCWDVTINILGEKSFDKNPNVCELSVRTLLELVKNVKENLTQRLTKNALKIMFKTLAKNLEGKRALLKKMSEETLKNILGYVSKNGSTMEDYLKYEMELGLSDINLIQKALQDKKNKQPQRELLKFIQEKKMKIENNLLEDKKKYKVFDDDEEKNSNVISESCIDRIKDIPLVNSIPEI